MSRLLSAIISGLLLGLCLPGFGLSSLAWIALLPLFVSLRRQKPGPAFLLGLSSGVVAALVTLGFFPSLIVLLGKSYFLGILILIVLSLYFALCTGTFALLLAIFQVRLAPRLPRGLRSYALLLLLPAAWVSLELLHTHIFPGLPWTFIFLGYSQWDRPALIQLADITGVYGVSFLVVLVNLSLYLAIREKRFRVLITAAGVVAASFLYGTWRIRQVDSQERVEGLRVAVLQGNIKALTKWDEGKGPFIAEQYLALNRLAAGYRPDLVIWTETAIPWPLEEGDDLVEACLGLTGSAYHLIGAPFPAPGLAGKYYNAAFFVLSDGEVLDSYRKVKLLTFAEAAPGWSEKAPTFMPHPASAAYLPGARQTPLSTPLGKFGISICNENSYPAFIRQTVLLGAECLVNLTNDAWFPREKPLIWHYMLNVFRAVENRRETVVAANVGISGFIDAAGRTKNQSVPLTTACLTGDIRPRKGLSFYTSRGDVFSWGCAVLTLVALVSSLIPKRTRA